MENSPDAGFVCTAGNCSKRFRRKEHLTRHLKSHDPAAQYRCRICGRTYARRYVMILLAIAIANRLNSTGLLRLHHYIIPLTIL